MHRAEQHQRIEVVPVPPQPPVQARRGTAAPRMARHQHADPVTPPHPVPPRHHRPHRLVGRPQPRRVRHRDDLPVDHGTRERHHPVPGRVHGLPDRAGEVHTPVPRPVRVRGRHERPHRRPRRHHRPPEPGARPRDRPPDCPRGRSCGRARGHLDATAWRRFACRVARSLAGCGPHVQQGGRVVHRCRGRPGGRCGDACPEPGSDQQQCGFSQVRCHVTTMPQRAPAGRGRARAWGWIGRVVDNLPSGSGFGRVTAYAFPASRGHMGRLRVPVRVRVPVSTSTPARRPVPGGPEGEYHQRVRAPARHQGGGPPVRGDNRHRVPGLTRPARPNEEVRTRPWPSSP